MNGLFNMDNPFWRSLGRLADLMILNIIFVVCCIPVFTIGASLTALSYVTLKMHDGDEGYITRNFFKSFRQNFKQATLMWLICLAFIIILVSDFLILWGTEGTFYTVLTTIIVIITIAFIMVLLYLFAVLSRFDNTIRNTFRNSFIMAIADFPRTIAMLALLALVIIVTFFNGTTLTWGILVWLMVGFAALAYCNTYFLNNIFNKYIPKEADETEDPDHWDVDETMGAAPKAEENMSADESVSKIADVNTDGDRNIISNDEGSTAKTDQTSTERVIEAEDDLKQIESSIDQSK